MTEADTFGLGSAHPGSFPKCSSLAAVKTLSRRTGGPWDWRPKDQRAKLLGHLQITSTSGERDSAFAYLAIFCFAKSRGLEKAVLFSKDTRE